LLEEHTAPDQSSSSDESDSSGTDNLTVGEVIGAECSDNESDDVKVTTAPSFECYIYVGGHDKLCRAKGTVC
jgi:hypothetical protein